MSTQSPTEMLIPQPPRMPLSDVREAAAAAAHPSKDEADEPPLSLLEQLKSAAAVGYYISAIFHVIAYGAMALVFAFVASTWNDDPDVPAIRASLDDFNRLDELPQFEEVGKIDLGSASSQTNIQKLNNLIQQSDDASVQSALQDAMPSLNAVEDNSIGGESDDDSFKFRVPESGFAVTKGSFTAWTVPESPEPGQKYRIVIQVKFPDEIKTYRLSDLTGKVTGTDGYTQGIPFDRDKRFAVSYTNEKKREVIIKDRSERIDVRNNKIQLVVTVPGAQRLVKDTIKLKSRKLREDQELTLVFGVRASGKRRDDSSD